MSEGERRAAFAAPRGGFVWRSLGYMFHILWINQMFFSASLYANYSDELLSDVAGDVFRTSIVALAISLALCAVFHRLFMALAEHAALDFCGPALAALGVVVIMPCLVQGTPVSSPALYGSAALTGLGSALTLINVGRRYVGVGTTDCIANVLWGTVASSLLSCVVGLLPVVGALAIVLASPFLSIVSLHRITSQEAAHDHTVFPAGEKASRRLLLKLFACASVLGIVTGTLGSVSPAAAANRFSGVYLQTFYAASFLASAALLAMLARRGRVGMESLYRPATFLITVGFALVPLFESNTSVPYACISAGYSLFEMLMWVILCEVASRFQFTSVQVFGFGRAFVVGSVALVMAAAPLIDTHHDARVILAVSALSIIAVALLRTYVLTSADLVVLERSLSTGDELEGADVGADAGSARARTAWGDASGQGGALGQGGASAQGDTSGQRPRKIPFLKRCAIIGDYYGLTKREVDVFRLLAAGRNSARIQEELMISAGTVNTHSHHVFQKMGVHCQQEVIDLFENADLDAIIEELARRGASA